MSEPREIPALSAAEAESFWNEGHAAYVRSGTFSPENQPDGFFDSEVFFSPGPGIDIPGVGHVPAATLPGSAYIAGEVPNALRRLLIQEERDGLLGKLLVSAGRLALSRIHAVWPSKRNQCLECGRLANAEDVIAHRNCRAGDILAVIDRLDQMDVEELDQLQSVNPTDGKEVAEVSPEHRAPAAEPAAGIPVSVIVPVAVINGAFRLLEMYRQSVLSRSAIGADPAATVPALDSVIADLRKAKGGAQ